MNLLPKKMECKVKDRGKDCNHCEHLIACDLYHEIKTHNKTLSDCKQSLIKGLEGMKKEVLTAEDRYDFDSDTFTKIQKYGEGHNNAIDKIIKSIGGGE